MLLFRVSQAPQALRAATTCKRKASRVKLKFEYMHLVTIFAELLFLLVLSVINIFSQI